MGTLITEGFAKELIKEESLFTGTRSSVEMGNNNKDCTKSNQGNECPPIT